MTGMLEIPDNKPRITWSSLCRKCPLSDRSRHDPPKHHGAKMNRERRVVGKASDLLLSAVTNYYI